MAPKGALEGDFSPVLRAISPTLNLGGNPQLGGLAFSAMASEAIPGLASGFSLLLEHWVLSPASFCLCFLISYKWKNKKNALVELLRPRPGSL